MEDIEDLLVGGGGEVAPGFRLPFMSVGLNPKQQRPHKKSEPNPEIPGTQTIYMRTFGCSHNQALESSVGFILSPFTEDLLVIEFKGRLLMLCNLFQSDSEYMAGQLSTFGYTLSDKPEEADLWLINTPPTTLADSISDLGGHIDGLHRRAAFVQSCTVKSPSQSAMDTLILRCKSAGKPLVVAGCVPQGSRDLKELEGVSIVGVQQIDRVVEVVEETLKGHEVRLLNRKTLPSLDLPKVRKNKFIEILPINVGCLGACTYCKTKHARGHLGSYSVNSLVERVKAVIAGGVKEIWLSSEDTGAYGCDIGASLPVLLKEIVAVLPPDRSTMLRVGMTNPPYILEHLKEIAEVLSHPCVYSFLHVPVQSGSDSVLTAMNREYTVNEFKIVVDTLSQLVPEMQIATDVICGFPGETDEDFAQTLSLIKEYQFPQVHISQFYPRPGTPAARMKKVPSNVVKSRSRELTAVFESFTPYDRMEGQVVRIWITEIATDGVHLVGHTKGYVQVLVAAPDFMMGTSTDVKITSVGRWSVFGELLEVPKKEEASPCNGKPISDELSISCLDKASSCSTESGACACEIQSYEGQNNMKEMTVRPIKNGDPSSSNYISGNSVNQSLRKRKIDEKERKESQHPSTMEGKLVTGRFTVTENDDNLESELIIKVRLVVLVDITLWLVVVLSLLLSLSNLRRLAKETN
ncbi:hypothetical protein Scep_019288 [Stephania cephalantha]|uniref:Threonylcarbamoyladenosine tRNA methylthiotransferase n=1 Tax=Stephania cephalantha TaxID=152367 RepID=A0AAP0IAF0_9MAGN